jgi:hypothetical protein
LCHNFEEQHMTLWRSSFRLVWDGGRTIRQIAGNLERRQRTVLRLPASYHPALSAYLYAGVPVRRRIDLVGDAGLLARIAEIDGLGELEALVQPMQDVDARVRLRSPGPHLVFNVPSRKRAATEHRRGEPWMARSVPGALRQLR